MVFCCVREVPVECLVEVQLSAQGRVMSPDDAGAVSMFSGVALSSVTDYVAQLSGLCSLKKVNMFSHFFCCIVKILFCTCFIYLLSSMIVNCYYKTLLTLLTTWWSVIYVSSINIELLINYLFDHSFAVLHYGLISRRHIKY